MSERGERFVFLDSAIFLYALGGEHPLRDASIAIFRRASRNRLRLYTNVEVIQEVAFHRLRRTSDRPLAVAEARRAAATCTVLNFDREVLDTSLELIENLPAIRGRDAVHAASALAYGIPVIVTPDPSFDGIPGLDRVSPDDFAATLT